MDWNRECELLKGYLSEYDKGYQDGSKETAEKILTKLQPYIGGWVLFKELVKQFGVEIKE